jgi:hypothetical protein
VHARAVVRLCRGREPHSAPAFWLECTNRVQRIPVRARPGAA